MCRSRWSLWDLESDMCSAQHAITSAARPLATQFCHPRGRGEDTTVGESQSAVDFFRRTDSVSSQAADAVVASESASALVSGRFVSLFLYLNLDPPTGCQHLGACDFDLGFWCGCGVAAGLPSFSGVLRLGLGAGGQNVMGSGGECPMVLRHN